MSTTSTDIVNQAIYLIGDNQAPVTGVSPTFDNSTAGKAAAQLYIPCVQTIAKQFGWDFDRNTVVLTLSSNTPLFPWTLEYLYPTNGVEVRQLMPSTIPDQFNPLPDNWVVCNNLVSSVPTKVIQTNVANALAVFTNQPLESTWDALFREAVVRLLASEMAMAINGRPDTARDAYSTSAQMGQIGQSKDG